MAVSLRLGRKDMPLRTVACDVRYRLGYLYLDRCGSAINTILSERRGWLQSRDVNPQGGSLVNYELGAELQFDPFKYVLQIQQPSGGDDGLVGHLELFFEELAGVSGILHEQFALRDFSRIGFRTVHEVPCDDEGAARRWVRERVKMTRQDELCEAFGAEHDVTVAVTTLHAIDMDFRIKLEPIRFYLQMDFGGNTVAVDPLTLRHAELEGIHGSSAMQPRLRQRAMHSVAIDVDAFRSEPEQVDPRRFSAAAYGRTIEGLPAYLEG